MRRIKIVLFFSGILLLFSLPLITVDWGECTCVNNREIFQACEDFCTEEESSCTYLEKYGQAQCWDEDCAVIYDYGCENGARSWDIFFKSCPEDCESPPE